MTIDPGFLDELERYAQAQKRSVASRFQGDQRSADRGEGLTFADYRQYSPGDDTRRIDWKLYARTDEFYVKEYEAERNLTMHVLLDSSGSMDYTGDSARATKFEYGAKIGLGFAYLVARQHNDFRFTRFSEMYDRLDRGRSNRGEVLALVDALNETTPEGDTDFARVLEEYGDTIGSRSLVLVVSDFLADPDAIAAGLEALSRNKLVLARVMDPAERALPVSGDAVVEDLESPRTLRTHIGARRRQSYQERLDAHLEAVADRARMLRAHHEVVDTGADFFDSFERVWVE